MKNACKMRLYVFVVCVCVCVSRKRVKNGACVCNVCVCVRAHLREHCVCATNLTQIVNIISFCLYLDLARKKNLHINLSNFFLLPKELNRTPPPPWLPNGSCFSYL